MMAAVGYFVVTAAGVALLAAGHMWWALGVLFVGLLSMNALSRR